MINSMNSLAVDAADTINNDDFATVLEFESNVAVPTSRINSAQVLQLSPSRLQWWTA